MSGELLHRESTEWVTRRSLIFPVQRLSKTPMVVGGREVLVYTTLGGSVGALIPFTSKSDVDFMTDLEMVRDGPEWLCGFADVGFNSTCEEKPFLLSAGTTCHTEATTLPSSL